MAATTEVTGEVHVTEEGMHLPDWLVGYTGEFTMRTANIDGTLTTTDAGLDDVSPALGAYPKDGDYNPHLDAGQVEFEADGRVEIYDVIDDREGGDRDD